MLQTGADTDFAGRFYGALRTVFALAIPLSAIGYVVGIPRLAGAAIYDEQFLSLLLGLCLALAFLARTGGGGCPPGSGSLVRCRCSRRQPCGLPVYGVGL